MIDVAGILYKEMLGSKGRLHCSCCGKYVSIFKRHVIVFHDDSFPVGTLLPNLCDTCANGDLDEVKRKLVKKERS